MFSPPYAKACRLRLVKGPSQPQAGKPWTTQKHGQEHGQANKQSIRRYSSLKISILAISIPPVTLQLLSMPSHGCAVLL
jgi:hypothetical protein